VALNANTKQMKTIEIKLYQFDELSEEAKEKAIEDYRDSNTEITWASENRDTMEKFADIFPIKIRDWSYGGRGEGVSFYFTADDTIEELSGQRLATYIWNNYKSDLFKGKYYRHLKDGSKRIFHKRIKSQQLTNKGRHCDWINAYYSGITLDNSCVLTGYCMDMDILDPIYKFLEKPTNANFKELLEECFDAWIKACNADVDWQNSDEYISEELANNDCEFEEDGTKY
jgi:hypothetical protein